MTVTLANRQGGVMLLEALIGILIFTIGILGLVGLQAVSIKAVSDAKYRADAAFLANQILSQMWADNPTSLASYGHKPDGDGCAFSGKDSTNAKVTDWKASVVGALPGTGDTTQQIIVGTDNTVKVTICWKAPNTGAFHSLVTGSQINGTAQ